MSPSIDDPIPDPAHTMASSDTIPSLVRLKPGMVDEHPEDCPLAARGESRAAAHAVFSSVWARLAIAAAAMESTSHETLHLFTHHASTLGYSFTYDMSTSGLAVLDSMTAIIPFFTVASSVGIIMDYSDNVSLAVMAVFIMVTAGGLALPVLLALFPAIALSVPCLSLVAAVVLGLGPRDPAAAAEHTLLHVFCDEVTAAFVKAAAMVGPGSTAESVPLPLLCDSSVLCHGPRAVEIHVLRHWAARHFDELTFKPVETFAGVDDFFDAATPTTGRSHSSSSVSFVDVFTGAHAPNAAELGDSDAATPTFALRPQRWPRRRARVPRTPTTTNVTGGRSAVSGTHAHDAAAAGELPGAEPLREILADDLAQQFAVSMAEVAAVLTPHPTPSALPANVHNSPLAYLTQHLAEAEMAASTERRVPLAVFMDEAGIPGSSGEVAPSVITASPGPVATTANGSDYCHIDLATETFDEALRAGWRWLLRFAWRRRSFAPLPGHATPGVFVDMWRISDDFGYTKAFGAWGTLAALLLSRPVLFFAPLLEPAFNTNVPTTAYVCIAVRVVCWVGIAMLAPSLYRTVCRTAAFSVVNGPEVRVDCTIGEAILGAARCIAAAYEPHLPTVLRRSVPHHVVSHVVIGDAVAPFLPPGELGNVLHD